MATSLTQAASGAFFEAGRMFRSSSSPMVLNVLVEDDIDKAFWYRYLSPYANKYKIIISIYRKDENELRGKTSMLKAVKNGVLQLSPFCICCVDADYDLLIDNCIYHDIVSNNPYVIHTVWYAIENVKCNPKGIEKAILLSSLPEKIDFSIESLIHKISKYYSLLFIQVLVSMKRNDGAYSIGDFASDVNNSFIMDTNGKISVPSKQKIIDLEDKYKTYKEECADDFDYFINLLASLGYTFEDYWKLFQGHMLEDYIAVPLAKKLSENTRIVFFRNLIGDKEQRKQLRNQYNNQTGVMDDRGLSLRIHDILRDNYEFDHLAVDAKIKTQLDSVLN